MHTKKKYEKLSLISYIEFNLNDASTIILYRHLTQ